MLRESTTPHQASGRAEPAAVMRGIAKSYGPVPVLHDVSIALEHGTVHALLGENGAGKSTLVKILAGALAPNRGSVEVGGIRLRPSPRAAHSLGVRCIHQNRMLATNLSVAENIALTRPAVVRNRRADRERCIAALDRVGAGDIDLDTMVSDLSKGNAQLVEIARELADDARLVIMDEPTASLSTVEAQRLLETIRRLRSMGTAFLLVSHDLEDVQAIADDVTVVRDGRVALMAPARGLRPAEIVSAMLGRTVEQDEIRPPADSGAGPLLLRMRGVDAGVLAGVDLEVRAGEVVGVTGILGSGIDEVARVAAGMLDPGSGTLSWADPALRGARISTRNLRAFAGYVPSDRTREGIFNLISAQQQLDLTRASVRGRSPLARSRPERSRALDTAATVGLAPKLLGLPGRALSGGNQQKVVLGRVLQAGPRLLVVHDPTRGVDIGARAAIHQRIVELARQGCGVLLVSSDMAEVASLSTRTVVLRRGRIAYQGPAEKAALLMDTATGGTRG